MASEVEEFPEEVLDEISTTLRDTFGTVDLDDLNSEDLYSLRDIEGSLRSKFGPISLDTLSETLRDLGYKSHNIGGTFYWLMRLK